MNVGVKNRLRCIEQGVEKGRKGNIKGHIEGTCLYLLILNLLSPREKVQSKNKERLRVEGLLFGPLWDFGESYCDR